MQWGTTRVTFRVDVTPSFSFNLGEENAQRFVGHYEQTDTVKGKITVNSVNLRFRNGGLQMLEGSKSESYQYMIPLAGNLFTLAVLDRKGDIEQIMGKQYTYEFIIEGGRILRYEGRDAADKLWETAVRKP